MEDERARTRDELVLTNIAKAFAMALDNVGQQEYGLTVKVNI
jgi:hypothetical protein